MRTEFKSTKEGDMRSLLGVQNQSEWIQSFNIGTIMHMNPIHYRDVCTYSQMICEL